MMCLIELNNELMVLIQAFGLHSHEEDTQSEESGQAHDHRSARAAEHDHSSSVEPYVWKAFVAIMGQ
jgi:ABC-type Zn2+ transport system substrate-binding protein/surface adhesin